MSNIKKLKDALPTSNLCFLFGAGINGNMFPNMKDQNLINDIKKIINPYDEKKSLEENITQYFLQCELHRQDLKMIQKIRNSFFKKLENINVKKVKKSKNKIQKMKDIKSIDSYLKLEELSLNENEEYHNFVKKLNINDYVMMIELFCNNKFVELEGLIERNRNNILLKSWEDKKREIISLFYKINCDSLKNITFKSSYENIKNFLLHLIEYVSFIENRTEEMKEINIFTLNYDSIIDNVISNLNCWSEIYNHKNIVNKMSNYNSIPYNFLNNSYGVKINVFKLHGDINTQDIIIPSIAKYDEIVNSSFYEMQYTFNFKMSRLNAVLIIAGYGFGDNHVNNLIKKYLKMNVMIFNILYGNFEDDDKFQSFYNELKQDDKNKFMYLNYEDFNIANGSDSTIILGELFKLN